MNDFKAAIEALPAKIVFIRHIFVGLIMPILLKCDICLDSEFDTLADAQCLCVRADDVSCSRPFEGG